jgi:hypothetical protein
VPPSDGFELDPSAAPVYPHFAQADPLPNPGPVVVQSRAAVELAIDDFSATYLEPTRSATFAPTEQLRAAVHSPAENSSLIPLDFNWSSSHCAVACRPAPDAERRRPHLGRGLPREADANPVHCPAVDRALPLALDGLPPRRQHDEVAAAPRSAARG